MTRRWFFAALTLVALAWGLAVAAVPLAAADRPVLLSYEALASADAGHANADAIARAAMAAPYGQRARFSQAVLDEIVPEIMRSLGIDPSSADTRIVPGGYQSRTNPSLQTRIALDRPMAIRLAAALGFVLGQDSVLISDLDDGQGGTFYAVVGFAPGVLSLDLAQQFFLAAAQAHQGLGGGYTAFGDEMIFINLCDGAGNPYSGLGDGEFAAALARAAQGFAAANAKILRHGAAWSRLVGNDWRAQPLGGTYAGEFDAALSARLIGLRTRYGELLVRQALSMGWLAK